MIKEYDEKTEGIIRSGKYLIIPEIIVGKDVVFKASCIATSGISCSGKVNALFDLIVFGDIRAQEMEVKGRLVCTGECKVQNTIIVQNDIWAEELFADYIETHDSIVAQNIDAKNINSEGSILIGKTLAIEELASSSRSILCGETAYGAGKVSANVVITGEPLDLDDGVDAVTSPNVYFHTENPMSETYIEDFKSLSKEYKEKNDFKGYIDALIESSCDQRKNTRLKKYAQVLAALPAQESVIRNQCRDVSLLLWMCDIEKSGLFIDWDIVTQWEKCLADLFTRLARNQSPTDGETCACKTDALKIGDKLIHSSNGSGVVETIGKTNTGTIVSVRFAEDGQVKKYLFPASEVHFRKICSPSNNSSTTHYRESIVCEPESYEDWLMLSSLLHEHGKDLAPELSLTIFTLLSSCFGLKAKFVTDRFREKGWVPYAE